MSLVKESQRVNANLLFNKSFFALVPGVMKVYREFIDCNLAGESRLA